MIPPRILIVWSDHWPRALLRAQLLEEGCDAVGAGSFSEALLSPAVDEGRGAVRLIVVDQSTAERVSPDIIDLLRFKHPGTRTLLLARGFGSLPEGPWDSVLRRPVSLGEVAARVREILRPADAAGDRDGTDL